MVNSVNVMRMVIENRVSSVVGDGSDWEPILLLYNVVCVGYN